VIRRVLKLQGGDRLVEVFEPEVLAQLEDVAQILGRSVVIEDTSKVKKNGPRKQCITFHSEEYLFGLPMEGIREIIRVPQIQKSVLAVDYCLGMFNLRGMIIPIIDFKQFISGERSQNSDSQRVIVIRLEEIQIGLLVDKIGSIAPYYDEDIQTYTASSSKIQDMMNGIVSNEGAEHVLILRPDNILNDTEILAISRGHHSLYGGVSADPRKEHKKVTDRKMYLRFQLQYPLSTRLNNIEEIARPEENMMRPPGSPDYVVGLLKLRGEMLMVVDLRSYYGLGQINDFVNSRIIVTQGAKAKYGFLVDSVESIDTVDESQKIQLPVFLVRDIARNLHGDMSEVVEMKDMSGNKKAFMILDLPELVRKLELKTA
jgi:purine-binding chemotaxis protein CheW